MLQPVTPNSIPNQVQALPPPVEIDGKPKHVISEILDAKIHWHCRPCNLIYLVWWSGYVGTNEEKSWILVTELGHASKIITVFHAAYPAKPGPWVPWLTHPVTRLFLNHAVSYQIPHIEVNHSLCVCIAVFPFFERRSLGPQYLVGVVMLRIKTASSSSREGPMNIL